LRTYTVKLIPLDRTLEVREGTPLLDVLHPFGVEFPCGGRGRCDSCRVKLLEGSIECDPLHSEKLKSLGLGPRWRLACLSQVHSDLVLEVAQFEIPITADETPFEFHAAEGMGVAFDLGTTTLVAQLVDLGSGRILAVETAMNPQGRFGSDLISRIESALAGSREEMMHLIRERVGDMVRSLTAGHEDPEEVVIVGNTLMHHLFCNKDVRPLSAYPFESPHLAMQEFTPEELGWKPGKGKVFFYPSIGSFVGSDILAGILATGMHLKKEYSVLVDLGTNGEIVVGNRDRLLCASTAAGPAFEGSRISMGMLAVGGAIASARLEEGKVRYTVIGNTQARGICGSGLIDVVAILLKQGRLGEYGEILSGEAELRLKGPVRITQRDIQEFQLAKSAIATGTGLLLDYLSLAPDAIREVYISGGFGSYLNRENLLATGMFRFDTERMHQLGNTALLGAKMFLFSERGLASGILERCEHVNLESVPGFQDRFVENLVFSPPA
jgi:uncharacterized 2Fe-2S/4Fe-4S cluster protein (DUF4445 family)